MVVVVVIDLLGEASFDFEEDVGGGLGNATIAVVVEEVLGTTALLALLVCVVVAER